MNLSCLQLEIRSPAVRQCLSDCQDMHRTLMKAFPQADEGHSREVSGVLYRVMQKELDTMVYVLSKTAPDWQAIAGQGFVTLGVKDVSSLPRTFSNGKRYAFDALLCPTKKVPNPRGNSRRLFLSSSEERRLWLERKAGQSGFALEWFREEGQSRERGAHGENNGGHMYHSGIRFKGVLAVTDSQLFTDAFSNGIGAGKAYGFGLLMLFKTP